MIVRTLGLSDLNVWQCYVYSIFTIPEWTNEWMMCSSGLLTISVFDLDLIEFISPTTPTPASFLSKQSSQRHNHEWSLCFYSWFLFLTPFLFLLFLFFNFFITIEKKAGGGGLKFIFWPLDQLSCQLLKTASLNLLAFNPQIYLISLFSLVCLFRGFSDTFMYPLSQSSSMCSFCTI